VPSYPLQSRFIQCGPLLSLSASTRANCCC
jgi:hypothetical protein